MKRIVLFAATILPLLLVGDARAQFGFSKIESVAITEFMNNPVGEKDGRQWVELYNFGKEPVSLKGFQLTDNGNEVCDIPEVTIKSGDFVILVLGHDRRRFAEDRKQIFETEWLGGKQDPRVVGVEGRFHLERAQTLLLQNRRRANLWMLGYGADEKPGMSTYLAMDKFDIRNYGMKEKPSINRRGQDGTVLGYEGQDSKQEDVAWTSDVSKIEALPIAGYLYQARSAGGTNDPAVGSPLKGNYPKP
jgi:hypothetical protein